MLLQGPVKEQMRARLLVRKKRTDIWHKYNEAKRHQAMVGIFLGKD
jgi:hypothetical protein